MVFLQNNYVPFGCNVIYCIQIKVYIKKNMLVVFR